MDHELLTPQEAALKLRLHVVTVRRMLRAGVLPGVKIGPREWRVSSEALQKFLEKGTAGGGDKES